ncbi:hypothetical protein [Aureimonas pseudogalii]|uniref:Uncharacterized protein n=1 Tax=Aureimonas pseudogalii TaxID=1744844 RepID=A0A7W6EDD1_9HYPH|nr:hypothetical protein [Aureimonas pseudogalii]MBB3997227.1 hypothetical protein [Aureimonas pseudogalii]
MSVTLEYTAEEDALIVRMALAGATPSEIVAEFAKRRRILPAHSIRCKAVFKAAVRSRQSPTRPPISFDFPIYTQMVTPSSVAGVMHSTPIQVPISLRAISMGMPS